MTIKKHAGSIAFLVIITIVVSFYLFMYSGVGLVIYSVPGWTHDQCEVSRADTLADGRNVGNCQLVEQQHLSCSSLVEEDEVGGYGYWYGATGISLCEEEAWKLTQYECFYGVESSGCEFDRSALEPVRNQKFRNIFMYGALISLVLLIVYQVYFGRKKR